MAADVTKRHTYHVLELHCANSTVGQEYGRAYAPAAAAPAAAAPYSPR